ncbi:MAG: hypothetical protein AB1758_10480 [Candidatus Eremiobacterota bacterium]
MAQRGIVLVTAMIVAVVAAMFLGAALVLGPASLGFAQDSRQAMDAQRAAESGVQYALARLKEDPAWAGTGNGVTVDTADLFVVEDNGNVIGLVRSPGCPWSQFRLRFNFQDGPGGLDGGDDPALLINHPFVSLSNLAGGASVPVPRADGPNFSVTAASRISHQTPIWSVSLAVEGRSGPGLRPSPANPDPPLALGGVTARHVEGVYQVPGLGPTVEEAGSMAGSDFSADLRVGGKAVTVESKDKTRTPRVRTKGTIQVVGGDAAANYVSKDGEVKSSDDNLAATYDPSKVSVELENPGDPFYELAWADVKKAPTGAPTMAGGTYVWWDDGSLHYYDMTFDQYKTFIANPANATDPGATPSLPPEVQIVGDPSKGKMKLKLTDSINVVPSKGAKVEEIAVIPREGAPDLPPGDPEAGYTGGAPGVAAAIASDPEKVIKFLLATQGPSGQIDINDPFNGSAEVVEIIWGPSGSYTGNGSAVTTLDSYDNGTTMFHVGTDIVTGSGTLEQLIHYTLDPSAYSGWSTPVYAPAPTAADTAATAVGLTSDNGKVDVPGVDDTLTASNLEMEFAPPSGGSIALTATGDVRLVGSVKGKGASIVSQGNIRVTGMGAEFSSGISSEDAVNMFSEKDIVFSTLDETTPGSYEFRDVKLKGIIYAQGDFVARLGSQALPSKWGNFDLEGVLIAYGGKPGQSPGQGGKGKIDLRAEEVKLKFDPVYIGALSSKLPADFQLRPISWDNHPR